MNTNKRPRKQHKARRKRILMKNLENKEPGKMVGPVYKTGGTGFSDLSDTSDKSIGLQ